MTTVERMELIDQICLEFEKELRAPKLRTERSQLPDDHSQLLELLADHDPDMQPDLLFELLLLESEYFPTAQFQQRLQTYRLKLPGLVDVIDSLLAECVAPADDSELVPGESLAGYSIQKKIGGGAFGIVYLAKHLETGQLAAIKIPRNRQDRTHVERGSSFDNEVECLKRLQHPGIVRLQETITHESLEGHDAQLSGMVLEYAARGTLRDQMQKGQTETRSFVEQLVHLLRAIEYCHVNGIVHRDIEPRNVLIREDGRLALADFGLALQESKQSLAIGESAGSTAYMSPEQIRGESHWLDGRSDLWSVGVIFYEHLAGRRPFLAFDEASLRDEVLYRPIKPIRQINPDVSDQLASICMKCLQRQVDRRYATAKELESDLGKWLSSTAVGVTLPVSKSIGVVAITIAVTTVCFLLLPSFTHWGDRGINQKSPTANAAHNEQNHLNDRNASDSSRERQWVEFSEMVNRSDDPFPIQVNRGGDLSHIDAYGTLPLRPDDKLTIWRSAISNLDDQHCYVFRVDARGTCQFVADLSQGQARVAVKPVAKGSESIVVVISRSELKADWLIQRMPSLKAQSVRYLNAIYLADGKCLRLDRATNATVCPVEANHQAICQVFRKHECHVYGVAYAVDLE